MYTLLFHGFRTFLQKNGTGLEMSKTKEKVKGGAAAENVRSYDQIGVFKMCIDAVAALRHLLLLPRHRVD